MLPVVIITGPMRSGTSAVAQIVHRLGFIPVALMTPPQPPHWHQDWEDFEALQTLMGLWPPGDDVTNRTLGMFAVWFDDYLRRRQRSAEQQIKMGSEWIRGVAFKSPMYAPFVPNMIAACQAVDIEPTIIVCDRDRDDRRASNRVANAGVDFDILTRVEDKIDAALERLKPALTIPFELMLSDPRDTGRMLATILGQDSGEGADIAEAVINTRTWA